jgi:hypothetical protein
MGVFVFLPLVLPLTAWPVARLAEQRLHPRTATVLLSAVAGVLAVCSTVCLALLMVVGTAQLPGIRCPMAGRMRRCVRRSRTTRSPADWPSRLWGPWWQRAAARCGCICG